jgi:hypothetical protein
MMACLRVCCCADGKARNSVKIAESRIQASKASLRGAAG